VGKPPGPLDRWLRDIERQMWVQHTQKQAVSFPAAMEMRIGDSENFWWDGPLVGKDGKLARVWYDRHYPRTVLIDAWLDARAEALIHS
jgi:hypothetical protein